MLRNDSPRISNKMYEIIKEIITNKISLNKFSKEFLEMLYTSEESHVTNIIIVEDKLYYKGFPSGNLLKIICKVFEYWDNFGYFPINFIKIEGLVDLTQRNIEYLNTQTQNLALIFNLIRENNIQNATKLMVNFFENIGMRGLLTILGVRMTPGSIDSLPQCRINLYNSFNQTFKKSKERDYDVNDYYSTKITVGARALAKHADRERDIDDENFWGKCNGSEIERNNKANEILNKMFDECVWINIHFIQNSIKIVEIRNVKGYGIRWDLEGNFRGFIEPQLTEHFKKS